MATHQGIEELLADFARIPTVHQPPPALNPLHMADCTPIASRHSSRRHMDPNSNNTRSSSTRSNPSPVHVVQKEYSGTRRRNIFHPSMTPSEGSVSSTSGCAVKHQESEHNENGAATGATSSLALSSSAAPSLSNSNHYGVVNTAVGAATVSSLNGVAGATTAPPTACSSPHVFIVPSVLEHHFVGVTTTREQSSDTFLPFGDLGSFAPPLLPLHTFYDADEQFSDDSQHCADDDEDGFALYTEDLAAFRTWRKQSAAQNELQTRHHFLSKLMVSSLEQRSRSVLMEFEFSERTHARNKFLDVISSEPPLRSHGQQGVAGPVTTSSSSPPTSHPSTTSAAMTMASSLLNDQKAAIQSLAGQLGTVLKSVNAIQHQRNVVSEAHELSQQHFHHILGKFMRLFHREARDRQRVCQEMHEAFGDIVASHHHTVVARLCLRDAAAQQQNHNNSHNATVLADSTSTSIRQSVDVEVQRMSMVLAVQLAEAKSSFEAQLRHQHDVEHRAYRNEIDEKLAVRRKAELQLREEIARLKCLLASAYGTIDPPNMPSLDQELHQLPSFHAKVQQEVERTLRASASTANQSTVYIPPPSLSQHAPFQGCMFPQPSLTEMPSFLAPTDLSTDAPNATASASSGPRQTGTHLYLLSAPDAPLSPGTENLVDFSWQS